MSRGIDVSVIVPTYDGSAYLDECLASIAAQDLTGVEVLVNDDGSSDDSVARAESYRDRIAGLRVHRNPERLGAVGNVNRCLEMARGRWVKPVFQDDLLEPGGLAALRAARRRGVPAVVGGRTYRFEDGVPDWQRDACAHLLDESLVRRLGSGVATPEQVAEAAVRTAADRVPQLNFVGEPVAVLLDRRAALRVGGFDTGYVQLWDYLLLVRLGVARGLALVEQPVAAFRVHGGSETARNLSGSAFRTNVLDRLRLMTAYAAGPAFRPVRAAAARHDPPIDLTAQALGVSWAAHRLAAELPPSQRPDAEQALAEVTAVLPSGGEPPWAGSLAATSCAVELLHALSDDVDAALADLYATEPLVHVPDPPAEAPTPVDETAPEAPDEVVPSPPAPDVVVTPPIAAPDPPPAGVPSARRSPLALVAKVARAVRTNQWWAHMLGPIVAGAALQIGWRDVDPGDALPRVLALLWSAISLAAYAYVVNDASDVEADRRVGKRNSMAKVAPPLRIVAVLAFAGVGLLPWLVVPLSGAAWALLGALYLVPLAYSPRPLRLKEHTLLGPLADASNAFVLPALFTISLFAPLGDPAGPEALMVVGSVAWAAGFGLRAIVLHQVDDAANDRATGTSTLVTAIGEVRAARLMRRVLFPVELVGLVLLTATVATWAPWLVVGAVVVVAGFHLARLRGVIDRSTAVTTIERGWFLYWTQIWPALLLSLALAVHDPAYLALTALVVVLFWPRLRAGLAVVPAVLANERLRRAAR